MTNRKALAEGMSRLARSRRCRRCRTIFPPLPKTWRVPRRSMAVVAVLEKGRLTSGGRIDLTRDAVIAFGRKLRPDDEE